MTETQLPSLTPSENPGRKANILPGIMSSEQYDNYAEDGETNDATEATQRKLGATGLESLKTGSEESDLLEVALFQRENKDGGTEYGYIVTTGQNIGDRVNPKNYDKYGLPDPTKQAERMKAQAEQEAFNAAYRPLKSTLDGFMHMQADLEHAGGSSERRNQLSNEIYRQFNQLDQQDSSDMTVAAQFALASAAHNPDMFVSLFERAVAKLPLTNAQHQAFAEVKERLGRLKSRPETRPEDVQHGLDGFMSEVYKHSPDDNSVKIAAHGIMVGAALGDRRNLDAHAASADTFAKQAYRHR